MMKITPSWRYAVALGMAGATAVAIGLAAPSAARADDAPQGQIINVDSGLCLDSTNIPVGSDVPAATGSVFLTDCDGSPSQQWQAGDGGSDESSGWQTIVNVQTGYCLLSDDNLTLWTVDCNRLPGSPELLWNSTDPNGVNALVNQNSGSCLEEDDSVSFGFLRMSSPDESCYVYPSPAFNQAWKVFS